MGGTLDPRSVGLILLATVLTLTVGPVLAEARNERTVPLLSACPDVAAKSTPGPEVLGPMVECGVGTVLVLAVPATFGLVLFLVRRR